MRQCMKQLQDSSLITVFWNCPATPCNHAVRSDQFIVGFICHLVLLCTICTQISVLKQGTIFDKKKLGIEPRLKPTLAHNDW